LLPSEGFLSHSVVVDTVVVVALLPASAVEMLCSSESPSTAIFAAAFELPFAVPSSAGAPL